jgi:hypothetical protein
MGFGEENSALNATRNNNNNNINSVNLNSAYMASLYPNVKDEDTQKNV